MKSALALTETKGWLTVGAIVLGAAIGLYFFGRKALATVGADLALLPNKVLGLTGDALGSTVSGAADAVGKFGLATNDALGGLPGALGDKLVTGTLGTGWFGETYSGFEYDATQHRWVKVVGNSTGDVFPVDQNGNVLSASGSVLGHFNG